MKPAGAIDIVKEALLMEYRGKALYESAQKSTSDPEVAALFQSLADEEQLHIEALGQQFKVLQQRGQAPALQAHTPRRILTAKLAKTIASAGYEAAVISAAIELEKAAVVYYQGAAGEADGEETRRLFQWLADWEKGHLGMLADLDRDLKEKIWFDHQFWPQD